MAKRRNPAAVALSRLGAKKGGVARAAKLTPAQRSESARKAVQARWAKAKERRDYKAVKGTNVGIKKSRAFRNQINGDTPTTATFNASDDALRDLLKRIKATNNPTEIQNLSDQMERVIFHRQLK